MICPSGHHRGEEEVDEAQTAHLGEHGVVDGHDGFGCIMLNVSVVVLYCLGVRDSE